MAVLFTSLSFRWRISMKNAKKAFSVFIDDLRVAKSHKWLFAGICSMRIFIGGVRLDGTY